MLLRVRAMHLLCRSANHGDLTGSVPQSWAQMPALTTVFVQPGNPGLCTQLPEGANFKLCDEDDPLCHKPLQASDSTACIGTGSPDGSGSSVPLAAIVAPIVAAAMLAAAAAGALYAYRRRRRHRVLQPQLRPPKPAASAAALGSLPAGGGGDEEPGVVYPSSVYAFHTEASWCCQPHFSILFLCLRGQRGVGVEACCPVRTSQPS
jgi:hypothetical protein